MKIKTIKIEIASDDIENIDFELFIKSIKKQVKKIVKETMPDNNIAIDVIEENHHNKLLESPPCFKYKYEEFPSTPINPCTPPYVITCMDNSNEQITINNNTLLTELKEII